MRFLRNLSFLALAVVLTVVASAALGTTKEASALTTTQMQGRINHLNDIVFETPYAGSQGWLATYETKKANAGNAWMDWSTDDCSGPSAGFHDEFRVACWRHDLSWRTLPVIDEASGRVWNERNRYAADQRFLMDARAQCPMSFSSAAAIRLCWDLAHAEYYLILREEAGFRLATTAESGHYNRWSDFRLLKTGGVITGTDGSVNCASSNNRCLPIN